MKMILDQTSFTGLCLFISLVDDSNCCDVLLYVKIIAREQNKHAHWAKEAIAIRRNGNTMN